MKRVQGFLYATLLLSYTPKVKVIGTMPGLALLGTRSRHSPARTARSSPSTEPLHVARFAHGSMVSLWYAKSAAQEGNGLRPNSLRTCLLFH
jgi:hypothetical protein